MSGIDLAGAHVLLTGASRGIGLGIARAMARRGAHLTLVGRDATTLATVAEETGGHPLVCDLSDLDQVGGLLDAARAIHGPVDVLVNNAAVNWPGPLATYDPHRLRLLLHSNLVAPLELTCRALPDMRVRRKGSIVNLSSLAGDMALRNVLPYASSKAGLSLATRGLRRELAGTGVAAQLVVLAVVATDMIDDTEADPIAGASAARFARMKPLPSDDVGERITVFVERGNETLVLPRMAAPVHALRFLPTRFADLLMTGIPRSLPERVG